MHIPKLLLSKKSIRLWTMLLLIVLSVVCFEEVVDDVFYDPAEGDIEAQIFDSKIINYLNQFRSPTLNQIMTDITALGSVSVLLSILIVVVGVLWSYRKYGGLAYLILVALGSGIFVHYLKLFFQRPRPELLEKLTHVASYSFPNGHSFAATAIYISLAYYAGINTSNPFREVLFYLMASLLIVLVAISRVFLGVHYPTDILAGVCGGAIWSLTVSLIYEYSRLYRRTRT